MSAKLLDGKAAAADVRAEVAQGVAALVASGKRPPGLAAVLVGDDPASQVYVGSKVKACGEVGIVSRLLTPPATTSEAELTAIVEELNADETMDGILVQLPLPKGIGERRVLDRVRPDKDVDGFHPVSLGKLWLDDASGFVPATPYGILELLRRNGVELAGKRAVVVGRSATVGKPMAGLLLRENCTVTVCHSRTRDLAAVTREAEILVAAIGRAAMLGAEHVRPGAVVVDVGINRVTDPALVARLFPNGERQKQMETKGSTLVGDVDFTAASEIASAITPVPGGVGPLTVALLMANTLKAARLRQGLPAIADSAG
ncbi:MAG TPA: bifunctional methylenetetrahydrofolate dehydrogenase/methenyltetrahydrofolate cyclohydrolase FolD [Thermoanaerobaculia bacterium]